MPANPLKIALVLTRANIGGAQTHVYELVKAFRARYQLVVITGEEEYLTSKLRALGVEVHVLSKLKREIAPLTDWKGYKELRLTLEAVAPKLIHAHSSKAGVLARLAGRALNIPVVYTAHGWAFSEGAPGFQRLVSWGIEWSVGWLTDGMIFISDHGRDLARRAGVARRARWWTAKNGVPAPADYPPARDATDRQHGSTTPVLLHVGRLSPVKNQFLLLNALAKVRLPFRAEIVGGGECGPALRAECKALGLDGKVAFVGEVDDAGPYFSRAHMFVLTSQYEGLPLSVLEAMSMRLPVVATRVGGVPEVVIEGETGLLAERGDADTLARHIECLISSPSLCTRFAEAGYARYRQYFQIERQLDRIQEVYTEMLGQTPE